jgi:hypothetical protein
MGDKTSANTIAGHQFRERVGGNHRENRHTGIYWEIPHGGFTVREGKENAQGSRASDRHRKRPKGDALADDSRVNTQGIPVGKLEKKHAGPQEESAIGEPPRGSSKGEPPKGIPEGDPTKGVHQGVPQGVNHGGLPSRPTTGGFPGGSTGVS